MMSLYKEKFLRARVAMMWEKSMIFDKGYICYEEVCKQKIKSALEGVARGFSRLRVKEVRTII